MISVFFSFIFSFILSCLVLSSLLSSLLSLSPFFVSVSVSVWCGVCPCVLCVAVCCWCVLCVGVGVRVWMLVVYVVVVERAVWHAEKPRVSTQDASVSTFKTSPCAPAPRAHVFQHVRVVPVHTGTYWTYTRRRFEWTHGVIASSAHQEKSTYSSHLPQRGSPKGTKESYPFFFEFGRSVSRTTCSRFLQSFPLPHEAVQLKLSWGKLRREPAVRWLDLSVAPAGIKQHERRWREGEDAKSQKKPLTFHNVSSFFASRCSFKHCLTCWVTSTCETVLETAARSKKDDTLWKVNGTTTTTCKKKWKSCTCAHNPHNIHHTDHTLLSCLVSSLFSSFLFSYISISSAILLKLTFANMSVGKARPCEQDTRMPINITAQKNFITLLSVGFLLADVVACSLLVGCWLYVCCMFAVTLGWLVGCHSRTRRRTVSCVFTFTKHHAGQHTKKTTSTGESCEQVQWQTWTQKKATHMFGKVDEQRP